MTLPGTVQTAASRGAPELSFSVEGAEALRFAAGPTIEFLVRVAAPAGVSIRSLSLNVQIRVAATRRAYDPATRRRLFEVFGRPEQWARSLRNVVWTQTTLVVPAFDESVEVKLPVPCTYDLEVAAARYLHALRDGDVPLELLFSGTVFEATGRDGSLRVTQLPWDRQAEYRLPVSVWRGAMDMHFPDSAWLRLGRDAFDRLCEYKGSRALPSWDAAVESLLREAGDDAG